AGDILRAGKVTRGSHDIRSGLLPQVRRRLLRRLPSEDRDLRAFGCKGAGRGEAEAGAPTRDKRCPAGETEIHYPFIGGPGELSELIQRLPAFLEGRIGLAVRD